jgi:carbon-monoxide dehydrogenase medium subunit
MIPIEFDYSAPTSLKEALGLLADPGAKALSGGMSLIPMMKLRLAAPEKIVDLGRVAELNGISESGSEVRLGALTTHFQVESSALVRSRCPLLAETAAAIGDVQVRNVGTIGGSVAHADPSADYPAALQALEAKVRLVSATGGRMAGIDEFLVDTFTTSAGPGEIVREVIVPVEAPGTGTAYAKMLQPASGFAIVGVAVRVRKSGGKVTFARIGVTGLSSRAYRAVKAEEALVKGSTTADAAALAADGMDASSDIHASAAYRTQMAKVYAARAISAALGRASG